MEEYIISEEQSKRLNIIKLLFAIFVVYIHSNMGDGANFDGGRISLDNPLWLDMIRNAVSSIISGCANSGFFLMASILLYRKSFNWKTNIKKKIRTLLVPYLIMNILNIFVFYVCQSIPYTKAFFGNPDNYVANFTVKKWFEAFGIGSMYPSLGPTWFLRNLFVLNVLSVLIKKCIDRFPKTFFILISLNMIFVSFNFCNLIIPSYLFIWCLGYYIVKYKKDLNYFDNKKYIAILYICSVAIKLFIFYNGIELLKPINNIYNIVHILIGIAFWYSCFTKRLNGKIQILFNKYSSYNFCIYIFHAVALGFLQKLMIKILPTKPIVLLVEYLLLPIVLCIGIIIFSYFLKRFLPKTYNVLTGSR